MQKETSYKFADISKDCVDKISNLEKELRNSTNQDIVLIAYQPDTVSN